MENNTQPSEIICQLCSTPIDISYEINQCENEVEPDANGDVDDDFVEEAECSVCYTRHSFHINISGEMPEDEDEDFEGYVTLGQASVIEFGEIPEGYVYVPKIKNPNQLRILFS